MAALTLLLYAFLGEMQVEYALSGSFADEKKAEQLAWSAIDFACVSVDNNTQPWHGPNDTAWYNNPDRFYEAELGDGAFTLLHPTYSDDGKLLWWWQDDIRPYVKNEFVYTCPSASPHMEWPTYRPPGTPKPLIRDYIANSTASARSVGTAVKGRNGGPVDPGPHQRRS